MKGNLRLRIAKMWQICHASSLIHLYQNGFFL